MSNVDINVDNILPETEQALNMYDSESVEIQNSVLGAGIGCEIRVLRHGLLMDKAVSEYDIQKSVTHLHLARGSLSEWRRVVSEQEYADKTCHRPEETTWRFFTTGLGNLGSSGSGSGGGSCSNHSNSGSNSHNHHHHHHHGSNSISNTMGLEDSKNAKSGGKGGKLALQLPNHIQWLTRWMVSEKAKMTLYFMNILLEKEQAMGGDERSLWTNIDPDMHGM